jgi:hypothetical protein
MYQEQYSGRNWHDFTQHSVCTVDISSQRTGEERNGCAAINVANGAMRDVQGKREDWTQFTCGD